MWVITVHGSVISPTFTQVLQHNMRYSVGKKTDSAIRLSGARVKELEGHLCVAPWNPDGPADGRTAVTWEPAPDPKSNEISVNKLKLQRALGEESWQTLTTPDFAIEEIEAGFEMLEPGDGVKFAGENWFCTNWQPLKICNELLKDVSVPEQEALRSFSIPIVASYDPASPPTHVISPTFKGNKACYYAISQAVDIVTPAWMSELVLRLAASWDPHAAGTDSFYMPSESAEEHKPVMDGALLQERRLPDLWQPNEKRKTMWNGWTIIALFPTKSPPDMKYLTAMGANVIPIDAARQPPITTDNFTSIIKLMQSNHVKAGNDPSNVLLAYFGGVQKSADWEKVYSEPARKAGIGIVPSKLLWKLIAAADPNLLFNPKKADAEISAAAVRNAPPVVTASTSSAGHMTKADQPLFSMVAEGSRSPRKATQATQDFIPSTHTSEAEDLTAPKEASKSPVKKPLRRRAGAARRDFTADLFADIEMESAPPTPVEDLSQKTQAGESLEFDSVPPAQPAQSRLRRRGTQRTQLDDFGFGDFELETFPQKGGNETQTKLARHQALYERSCGASQNYRRVISEAIGEELEGEEMEVEEVPASQMQTQPDSQAAWIDGESDFVQRSIKRHNLRRQAETQAHEENEEQEEIEVPRRRSANMRAQTPKEMRPPPLPVRTGDTSKKSKEIAPSQMARDEDFLQAVKTSTKSKKALDAFDQEFNQLRIARPGAVIANSAAVKQNEHDATRPDYGIVKDFDHSTTGDFIVIERVNLFRKDSKPVSAPVSGGPNFKKFRKKNIARSQPLAMKLAAPAPTFGVDDAYWREEAEASQSQAVFKRPRDTQESSRIDETQFQPRQKSAAKKKREIHDSEDEDTPGELPAAKRPRARAQAKAPTDRSRRDTTSEPTALPPPRAVRASKSKSKPIVIEDSDDEEPLASVTMSATPGTSASASTLDASAVVGPASASGRRKRLAPVDDDDSGLVFGSATATAKRRRRL